MLTCEHTVAEGVVNRYHMTWLIDHLTRGGHTDSSRPIVVHVCQFVGKSLNVVGLETRTVRDHNKVSGRDRALTHVLTHKEEVIATRAQNTHSTLVPYPPTHTHTLVPYQPNTHTLVPYQTTHTHTHTLTSPLPAHTHTLVSPLPVLACEGVVHYRARRGIPQTFSSPSLKDSCRDPLLNDHHHHLRAVRLS